MHNMIKMFPSGCKRLFFSSGFRLCTTSQNHRTGSELLVKPSYTLQTAFKKHFLKSWAW